MVEVLLRFCPALEINTPEELVGPWKWFAGAALNCGK